MSISQILCNLRRDKNVTQEKMAAALGVAFQTVSKWERGESYPDIMLLPVIAAYFETTTDFILGTDEERKKQRWRETAEQLIELRKKGDRKKTIAFLRGYVEQYPEDYHYQRILAFEIGNYADMLDNFEQANSLRRDALGILEHIVAFRLPADNHHQSNEIKFWILDFLWQLGEDEKAEKIVNDLNCSYDVETVRMKYLRGRERIWRASEHILSAFEKFIEATLCMVDVNDEYGCGFSDGEKLARLNLAYNFVSIVFDDGHSQNQSETVAQLCIIIAELCVKTDDIENAFHFLTNAAKHAAAFDRLDRNYISKMEKNESTFNGPFINTYFSSTLLKGFCRTEPDQRTYKEPTASGEILKKHLTRSIFDAIRSDPCFTEIEEQFRINSLNNT